MASSVVDIGDANRQVRFTPEMLEMLFAQRESRDSREAFLLIKDGRRWGGIYRLKPGTNVPVGRVAADGILLRDDRCSRIHCEFYLQGDAWYVRDRGSRNGTRLNGKKIQVARSLNNGDIIRVGNTKLLFTRDLESFVDDGDEDSTDNE